MDEKEKEISRRAVAAFRSFVSRARINADRHKYYRAWYAASSNGHYVNIFRYGTKQARTDVLANNKNIWPISSKKAYSYMHRRGTAWQDNVLTVWAN